MSSSSKKESQNQRFRVSKLLVVLGSSCIIFGLGIFLLTFYPVLFLEIKYSTVVSQPAKKKAIKPVDENFGMVIPKIEANAKVIANVNPFNEREYQWQLTKGVAHAKGTAFPDQFGNVFIFSHSSGNWYEANRFNSIFYLLHKMEKNDTIYVFYKKRKFTYKVREKKLVDAKAVSYLLGNSQEKTLTLMTCWPPGTTIKRLLIVAEQVEKSSSLF